VSHWSFKSIQSQRQWLEVEVNGQTIQLPAGSSVLAGLLEHSDMAGAVEWFCAIGQCQHCRVQINGKDALACQIQAMSGDQIKTHKSWSG